MSLAVHSIGAAALELNVLGTLRKDDYKRFVPLAEARIEEHGKVGLLVRISNMRGWSPAALWEDLKFDARHYGDVSRLALVGADASKDWIATISKPFTSAEVEYYPEEDLEEAREWVREASAGRH